MSLFRRAAAFAVSAAQRATNLKVQLQRGELSTSNVPVAIGRSIVDVEEAEGASFEQACRDYFIKVADYAFAGQAVEPKAGDRIVESIGGKTAIYELLPWGDDPAARYWDEGRTAWRCHTKLKSES